MSNNNQQTAVEWLYDELTKVWYDVKSSKELLKQAKQMEKEQHSKTFEAGNKRGWSGYPNTDNWTQPTFEQYYNETFNTK